jgi:hypothetical protein
LVNPFLTRLRALGADQVLRRVRGRPSPATFWSLPEPPAVVDEASAAAYRAASPSPRYLMDYRSKLRYSEVDGNGILVLNYADPTGTHVNPEAAFQQALGMHDAALLDNDANARAEFLRVASFFLANRTTEGFWPYRFQWHGSAPPWFSALAQARGASVMLSAWLLTGRSDFRDAAVQAVSGLDRPIAGGGFLAIHRLARVPYFEEYPAEPTAVLNGFMATLFGVFELAVWVRDDAATRRFDAGLQSLEALLPHYEHARWTLYDLDPRSPLPNPNSPRYHRMVTDYLRVLTAVTGRTSLAVVRDRWAAWDHPAARIRAGVLKAYRKLAYR